MSDRLTELQRQRALAQEQVAWFDREIAREANKAPSTPSSSASQDGPNAGLNPPTHPGISPPLAKPATARPFPTNPDELLKQYQGSGQDIRSEVKRGCLIYFFAAFALLGLGLAVFYYFWRR